jgi:2'-5' RNA ligase
MPEAESSRGRPRPSSFNQNRANLYIVFAPPEPVAEEIEALAYGLKSLHKLKGRLRRRETFHVTLVTLPRLEAPPSPTDRIIGAIGDVLSQMRFDPIEICFDRIESLNHGSRRPLVLSSSQRNEALHELERRLREKLHIPKVPGLPFKPHLTMIWDRVGVRKNELRVPFEWTAEKPSLIFSHVGQSRYDWLWPDVRMSESSAVSRNRNKIRFVRM